MSKEKKYVVDPLVKWFKEQKADWKLHTPKHATSSTGWDIEARRNNLDLLIEAKYITGGPFLNAFSALVTAPIANRPQSFVKTKYRNWCYWICWAIGISGTDKRNLYQALFDYFARNPKFWKHYIEDLRIRYIYFVKKDKVARVPFKKFLALAIIYGKKANGKKLKERRYIADSLMEKYKYS